LFDVDVESIHFQMGLISRMPRSNSHTVSIGGHGCLGSRAELQEYINSA
jgi:hypothetical protein